MQLPSSHDNCGPILEHLDNLVLQRKVDEWWCMIKPSLFNWELSNMEYLQPCVTPLAIFPKLDWYCLTNCSKTISIHIIKVLPIKIYLSCFLLSVLVLDAHTGQKCKNKFQLTRLFQSPRLFLLHSIEIFFSWILFLL